MDAFEQGFYKQAMARGLSRDQTQMFYKEANIANLLRSTGNLAARGTKFSLKHPLRAGGNLAKGAFGVTIPAAMVESTGRTVHNYATGGEPGLALPKTTTGIAAAPLHHLLGMTQLLPIGQGVVSSGLNGITQNPGLVSAIDKVHEASKNFKDVSKEPVVQQGVSALSNGVAALRDLSVGGEAQSNVIDGVSKTIGKATGEAFQSFGEAALKPKPLLYGSAAIVGPMIAYDLLTRKRRKERAAIDKELLKHIKQKKAEFKKKDPELEKEANALVRLGRLIYKPTKISPESTELMSRYARRFGGIPAKSVSKIVGPQIRGTQSLLNNSLTRNPWKTYFASGVPIGLANAYETSVGFGNKTNPDANLFDIAGAFGKGLLQGPYGMFKGIELNAFKSGGRMQGIIDNNPTIQKVKETIDNFKTTGSNVHQAAKAPAPPYTPTPEEPYVHPMRKALPYLGIAATLGVPYAGYEIYDRYHNKDRRKLDEHNEQVKKEVLPAPSTLDNITDKLI